jgi:glycosyltransferase involved in cell wall biosynthesis
VSKHLRPTPLITRPRVSVIVPCYNYGHYLPDAVGSALDQPDIDVDVLIIDDASPDGSGEVAEAMAAVDPRVRAIRHTANRGHIETYNEGFAAIDGDYVVLLSADDLLTRGALTRAATLLEAQPSIGFVYGYPVTFVDQPPPIERVAVRSWTLWTGPEWIAGRAKRGRNCIFSPEVVMRTSVQHAIGDYRLDMPHIGDFEMWLRAASVADVGRVNGPVHAFYRVHAENMHRTTYKGQLTDLYARRDAFAAVFEGRGATLPNAARLDAQARRALAVEALRLACRAFEQGAQDDEPVDEYMELALEVHPDATRLRQWRALERRRWFAGHRSGRAQLLAPPAVALDVADRVRWRRWRWSGE